VWLGRKAAIIPRDGVRKKEYSGKQEVGKHLPGFR
jgi:hypothetical protein